MASKETFRYKISLKYINSSNTEIVIDSNQLHYIVIDKDFDNNNMPVIAISGSIEKNIIDDMINNIDNNIVTLGIYKYDNQNQSDGITTKYFNDRFLYIIPDDISKTAELDYPEGKEHKGLYKDITIWLLQQDAVNNNRQSINGIFKNATTNTMILYASNFLGKMLLEPVRYDNKYEQIIIPPQDSISNYIKYLNNNLSVFYDSPYRFFIDFDTTYITSSYGKKIEMKGNTIYTIEINVKDLSYDQESMGMITDSYNHKYTINVNNASVDYTKNNITNKLVNKVTIIDSLGNTNSKDVDNNKINNTSIINKIINISNIDNNAINSITYGIDKSNVMITIVKNDLDASIFTINKEYIVTDPYHKEYAGKYLLTSVKQLYIKQTDNYCMTCVLSFKKL